MKEGDTAKLLCPQRTETISTTWTGPVSENPIADGRQISYFFKSGKFSVTGNFSSGESILVINTVTSADQGDYTCDIVVDGMPLQHRVELILESRLILLRSKYIIVYSMNLNLCLVLGRHYYELLT